MVILFDVIDCVLLIEVGMIVVLIICCILDVVELKFLRLVKSFFFEINWKNEIFVFKCFLMNCEEMV